jgi:hypothetical protein
MNRKVIRCYNKSNSKHTMSNDNMAIYTGYQYRVNMQMYEVIEVDTVYTYN